MPDGWRKGDNRLGARPAHCVHLPLGFYHLPRAAQTGAAQVAMSPDAFARSSGRCGGAWLGAPRTAVVRYLLPTKWCAQPQQAALLALPHNR